LSNFEMRDWLTDATGAKLAGIGRGISGFLSFAIAAASAVGRRSGCDVTGGGDVLELTESSILNLKVKIFTL
jgi:hypothetical protein